ncbi:lipopolysaccharide transport periplasmic protein LptA [Curvibacter sp. RS43]|jgi:lipopolysaccharide export system protein LptA|uniref:Lipopolysaccharide export system protein LptA n=1 Tax=Curvibacter microcysteis TaxID=3026419 RepID=A0ABT5MCM9_9BURK|nr:MULTISPECIES: lipopolysaccharide transport periplasmic protein LptA [unclassified Curvibacter]MDD0812433.1 lipopolysaccharide transport periplasmic protein LptA [Curvibacter sp. RS43]MDD0813644.1 lipopolysaccharide transport periplasmic protein LptA [Curvibacter sp. HBC28]
MKPAFLPSLLLILACLAAPMAWAERADRGKPMNIESDNLRHDDLKQVSVFTGRVIMTKGTIVIRGARLDVRQDAEGYQYGVVFAEPGQRAFYRQKRDGGEEYIEGEGETIEYDGRADNVKFIKRGELRRYRGNTLNDQVTGDVIVYDNVTDVFTVDGIKQARNVVPSPAAPGERVRAMLSPRGPAADAAAPPVDAGGPRPVLRSTNGMEGSKP